MAFEVKTMDGARSIVGDYLTEAFEKEVKENAKFNEAFTEAGQNVGNTGSALTTKIARSVFAFAEKDFSNYAAAIRTWTPAELGGIDGAGVYKVPKVAGMTGAKFDNDNDNTVTYQTATVTEMTVSCFTYYSALRVNRRLAKTGAPGVVKQIMEENSAAIHRAKFDAVIDKMIAGVKSATDITGGLTWANLVKAKKYFKGQKDTNGVLQTFKCTNVAMSPTGWETLQLDEQFRAMAAYNIGSLQNVNTEMVNFNGTAITEWDILEGKVSNAKAIHAIAVDNRYFLQIVQEGGMDIYSGRLPQTAGDYEHIFAIDVGMAIAADTAGVIITAA